MAFVFKFLFIFAFLISTKSSWADCLDGFYDLGPNAAALSFFCRNGDPSTAELFYCNRKKLIETGVCTGAKDPVSCHWNVAEQNWVCERDGAYPLQATISRISGDRIIYRFKSSFNSGELEGSKINWALY